MIYFYLALAFIAGFFSAIGAGAFITYVKHYELNRKHNKNNN